MQTCPPDSVDSYLELIRAVDHPAFGVPLMLEHLASEADYRRAAGFVRDIMRGT